MKNTLTFFLVLFTVSALFGQTNCTVKIVYSINKSLPPSYTFKIDPQTEGAKYLWSFGDNAASDSPSPTHTYKLTDTYAVSVKVTKDTKVCTGEIKERFEGGTVTTPPVATVFTGKGKVKNMGTATCGLVITLDNGTVLVPVEIVPNFVLKDGQYVELTYEFLTDKPSACTSGKSAKIDKIAEIIVPSVCKVPITFTKNTANPPVYTFKTESQAEGSTYSWTFGDGGTSTIAAPTHSFKTTGIYLINLKVVTGNTICTSEIRETFIGETIITPPVCKVPITFTKSTTSPAIYTFKTEAQADGSTYSWSFGDGGTSTVAAPTHSFKTTGSYVINLKVIKGNTVCYGEIKETFTGEANPILSGKGTVKKLTATDCEYAIVLDNNGGTLIPHIMVTNFAFREGQKIEFTYEKLAEKVNKCKEGTDIKVVTIKEIPVTIECKAYFSFARYSTTAIKKIVFTNLSIGVIKECKWNFGDNTTSADLKPIHEYAAAGEYKVCLTISTTAGCISDYCATVKIETAPVVTGCAFDLVVKPKPETPNTFLFSTVSQAEIKTWSWKFGDGKTSDAKNPEHTYEKTGTYEVSCVITTAAGCTQTRTIKHTVLAAPLKTCTGAINLILYDATNLCNGKAIVKLLDDNLAEITTAKYLWSDGRTTSTVDNLCPDKPYTVQVYLENNCQKNASFTLLSKPIWKAATINGMSNFSVIDPKDGVNYEWDFGNGTVLTGSGVNYNFATDGTYEVKLKAAVGGDFSEYTQQVVVMNSVTKTDIISQSELEVYPNPVNEMLRINFRDPVQGNLLIEIMNIAGQKVYTQQINAEGYSQADVNVQQLKSGIYLLRISNGSLQIANRKFIKAD